MDNRQYQERFLTRTSNEQGTEDNAGTRLALDNFVKTEHQEWGSVRKEYFSFFSRVKSVELTYSLPPPWGALSPTSYQGVFGCFRRETDT